MAKKVLAIVETDHPRHSSEAGRSGLAAHTQALRRAGADVHLLLRGSAVLYGVSGQKTARPRFGNDAPPSTTLPDADVVTLVQDGKDVFYVEDDAQARSIAADALVAGLKPVRSHELPALLHGYEQVWHW